jgi:hypothetical protein
MTQTSTHPIRRIPEAPAEMVEPPAVPSAERPGKGLLSVITATIPGREESLAEAMRSVAGQTHVIDAHLVSCEAPHGPSPVHQATQLNRCLAMATSDWIAVIDDDNTWLPDHAQILLTFARYVDADVIYSFDRDHQLPREDVSEWPQEQLCATLEERNVIDGGSGIIRREKLLGVGGFPTEWSGGLVSEGGHYEGSAARFADWELWRRLAKAGAVFRCVPASTWVYNGGGHLRMQTGLG